jgi:hypothetical protein
MNPDSLGCADVSNRRIKFAPAVIDRHDTRQARPLFTMEPISVIKMEKTTS